MSMLPPDKRYFRIWPHAAFPNAVPTSDHDPDVGDDLICATFSASFLPYVLGALEPLTSQDAWDTDDLPTAETNVYRVRMLQTLLMGGGCEVGIQGIRFLDCDLQITENGIDWITVDGFDPDCFTGPQGIQGIPGTPGADGIDGIDGSDGATGYGYTAPAPAPAGNELDVLCGTATRLEEMINQTVNVAITAAGSSVSLAEVLIDIVEAIPGIGWELGPLGSAVTDFINYGLGAATAAINDPSARSDVRCFIFCRLADTGVYSRGLLDAAMLQVVSDLTPSDVFLAYALLVSAIGDDWLQSQAYLGSLEPSAVCAAECECDDNPCKPGYWNFETSGPQGWTTTVPPILSGIYGSGYGQFIQGVGWKSVTDDTRDRLRIFYKCPGAMPGGSFFSLIHYSTENWENRYGNMITRRQDTGAIVDYRAFGFLLGSQDHDTSYTALVGHGDVPVYLVIDFDDDNPENRSMTIHDLTNT